MWLIDSHNNLMICQCPKCWLLQGATTMQRAETCTWRFFPPALGEKKHLGSTKIIISPVKTGSTVPCNQSRCSVKAQLEMSIVTGCLMEGKGVMGRSSLKSTTNWSSACGLPRSRCSHDQHGFTRKVHGADQMHAISILHIWDLCCRTFCERQTIYLGPRVSIGKSATTLAQTRRFSLFIEFATITIERTP